MSEEAKPNGDLAPVLVPVPAITIKSDAETDHADDLLQIRNVQATIANVLSAKGVPQDPETLNILLKTLKDMSSNSIAQMRIKVEEKAVDNNEQMREMAGAALALMVEQHQKGVVPVVVDKNTEVPQLDDSVMTHEFVEGEALQGTINRTFEEFVAMKGEIKLANNQEDDELA